MGQNETPIEVLYMWNRESHPEYAQYIYINSKLTIEILYNKSKIIFNYPITKKFNDCWTHITDIKEINLFKMKYL